MRSFRALAPRSLIVTAVMIAVAAAAASCITAAASAAAFTPFTSPDGLWTWSRPLPFGYPSESIAAPAPGTMFAATSVADLLTTHDAGSSWAWSPTGSVSGFAGPDGVAFISARDGCAWGSDTTGESGMVVRTTDGGATWQSTLTIPGEPWLQAWFAGRAGWVLAGQPGDEQDFALYTTMDGGATWSSALAVPRTDATTFAAFAAQGGERAVIMEQVWSRGASSGTVLGTRVWRTTDGGVTWLRPTTMKGAAVWDARFSSATRGWATGARLLWGTTDGGASWHVVRKAPGYARIATIGSDVWVISAGSSGAIHSSNRGVTWHALPGLSGRAIAFADRLDGWVEDFGKYLHTTDGGVTWHRVTGGRVSVVNDLTAGTNGTVWAAAGRVIKSVDGGRHWKVVTRPRGLKAITAVGGRRVWAAGRKGLVLRTIDGGRHWARQATGVSVDLYDIVFVDALHGWAAGEKGTVLRTVDGGRHWKVKHIAIAAGIRQLAFADARHGIALADRLLPTILVTGNGGRTWSRSRLPISTDRPTAVTMQDASHAVIIAYDRTNRVTHSWTSSDGGRTWQQGSDMPRKDYYVSLTHSGTRFCAVGMGGSVATSADGVTWATDVPSGGAMTSAVFVDADLLMVSGAHGELTRDLATAPLP